MLIEDPDCLRGWLVQLLKPLYVCQLLSLCPCLPACTRRPNFPVPSFPAAAVAAAATDARRIRKPWPSTSWLSSRRTNRKRSCASPASNSWTCFCSKRRRISWTPSSRLSTTSPTSKHSNNNSRRRLCSSNHRHLIILSSNSNSNNSNNNQQLQHQSCNNNKRHPLIHSSQRRDRRSPSQPLHPAPLLQTRAPTTQTVGGVAPPDPRLARPAAAVVAATIAEAAAAVATSASETRTAKAASLPLVPSCAVAPPPGPAPRRRLLVGARSAARDPRSTRRALASVPTPIHRMRETRVARSSAKIAVVTSMSAASACVATSVPGSPVTRIQSS